jgi:hypothetical protein
MCDLYFHCAIPDIELMMHIGETRQIGRIEIMQDVEGVSTLCFGNRMLWMPRRSR